MNMNEEEKKEIASAMESCKFYADGLTLDALKLAQILYCPENRKLGSGEVQKFVLMRTDIAAEIIAEVQQSIHELLSELYCLLGELKYYVGEDK